MEDPRTLDVESLSSAHTTPLATEAHHFSCKLSKDYTIAWWHQTICLSCRARESIWFRTKNILIFIKASLMITFIKVNSSWF